MTHSGSPAKGKTHEVLDVKAPLVHNPDRRDFALNLTVDRLMSPKKTLSSSARAIDVVIVGYNCRDSLVQCLSSLKECRQSFDLRIVVVDNASSDGTPDAVTSMFPEVRLVQNKQNLGFASGCNIGILWGHEELILLLNPDCVLDASALRQLVDCVQQEKTAACAAPNLEKDAKPSLPVYRGIVTLREFLAKMLFLDRALGRGLQPAPDECEAGQTARGLVPSQEVDYAVGACLLCRRLHLESVGLFDPGFFLYFEDQDLSLRLRKRGFRILLCPEARVEHLQGVSADQEVERAVFESYRSLCYFFDLHRDERSRAALRLVIAVGVVIRLIAFGLGLVCGRGGDARSRIAAYRRVISEIVFKKARG